MSINNIKTAVVRHGHRGLLQVKKYSPQLLTAAGIVGGVTAGVMGAKATLKAQPYVIATKQELELVRENKSELDRGEYNKMLAYTYAASSVQMARIYGPTISVATLSIASIIGAQGIMQKREAALTAAYVAVEKGFNEYRKRVEAALGETAERELRYGVQTVTEERDPETDAIIKTAITDPNAISVYARYFDDQTPRWRRNAEYNRTFLQAQQSFFNDLLRAQGHVFLNEVYDALGFERTQAGQVVGWVLNGDGDNFIDFGIFDPKRQAAREFINGNEYSVLLDFNVDGLVYDKI